MVQGIDLSNILNTEESEQATGIDLSNILVGLDGVEDDQSFALGEAVVVPESGGSEFFKGLKRGFNNMQALTGDAIQVAGELLGSEGLETYGAGVSAKNKLEAAQVGAPVVPRVEDVTLGNLSSFVSNSIGEALPFFVPMISSAAGLNVAVQMIPQVRAALAAVKIGKIGVSALGAYLPSAFLSTGEAASEQKDMAGGTTSTPDPMQALFTGLKAGSLDALTIIPIVKAFRLGGGKVAGPKEIEEVFGVSRDIAKKVVAAVPGVIAAGGTAAIVEAPTEAAQERLFIKDAEKVTGQKMNQEEYESRLLNAFVQGAIGGGAIGTGARITGNIIGNETVDERLKINDLDEGTVVKYPDFETFQKEVKPEEERLILERYKEVFPNGINNRKDFEKLRTAEMEHIVDKPLHKTMREIYAKGGQPFAANYYGKGKEMVRYFMPGNPVPQSDLVDTSRAFKLKKGAKEIGGMIRDVTFGKSIGMLADLSRYSPTLKSLIQDFEYYDDPSAKTDVQGSSLYEAITLKTAEFDRLSRKAEQKASKFFRLPFTSRVTPKVNREAYAYINNPAGYQGSAQGRALGEAYAEEFQNIYNYAKEAKYERGGPAFEGRPIGFDPGFIENYFPIMLNYKKFQSSKAFREQFKNMLENEGFENPESVVQAIVSNDGLTNLSQTVGEKMDPTKKAGNIEFERKLKGISFDKLAPFINTNVFDVLRKYRDSVVRRIEYAKRFGMNNEILEARLKAGGAEVQRKRGEDLNAVEAKRFYDLGRAMQKQYKPIESRIGRALNSGLITYGYILTLPFATISSFSEPFLVLSRGGAGPKVILKSLFSGVKGIIRNTFPRFPRDEYDNAVMDIGIGMDAATTERLTAAFGGGQETNRFTEQFFRLNFLSQFTRWNRLLAAAAGRNMIMNHARFLSKGMEQKGLTEVSQLPKTGRFKRYQEQLRELGIEPQDAVDFIRSEAVRKNNKAAYEQDPFYQDSIRLGSLRYVNEVVMNPRATTRPMWMSDPHLAIFGQLKGFQVAFSNTVLKRWYNEIFRSGFYNGMDNGAKYAAVGAMMVVAAALANEFREWVQYGPEGNPRYEDEDELEKLFRALERTGFLGPVQFLLDSARAEKFGSGPVEALMGPIVTRLVSYLEGVADLMTKGEKEKLLRELIKSIPILGSTPQIRNRLYEALGVESTFGQKKSDFAM